ncbi:tetratricopeptide repeat-containing sensor histidine kinase [Dyadobacter helix]|nr:tetratricopeptide repeat-containing sensor histidine kinase [Dyadobacter sp. CECT 9275]
MDSIADSSNRLLDLGNYDAGIAYFDSAYQAIRHPGVGDRIRKYDFIGHSYYRKMGEYSNANKSLDTLLDILSTGDLRNEYIREYSAALFHKGDVLFDLKRYNEAYHYYYEGKIVAQKILNRCALSEYSYRLGMVSYRQGKYRAAAYYFRQCLGDQTYCEDNFATFAMKQELLANTALAYDKCGEGDSSLIYSHKALSFIKEKGGQFADRKNYLEMARGVIYGNQADVYARLGQFGTAEKLLKKSIQINSRKEFDMRDAQITLLKLGELYLNTNKMKEALLVTQQLKASLDTLKNKFVEIGYNKLCWNYYDKIQDDHKAYEFVQKYQFLKDSLEKENRKLVLADADKEFRQMEQQNRYNLLSKEYEQRKIYLLIAILFAVMALAILILIWQNAKTSRKNVSVLTLLNNQVTFQNAQMEQAMAELKQSNEDKDRILKVVAHDLRNPIGAISNISLILLEEAQFSKEHRELMELVKKTSWQSIEMINDLLSASLNNRPVEMSQEMVNASNLLMQCVDQLRFKINEKGQELVTNVKSDIELRADKVMLGRVWSNLIFNAIKFSPLGSTIYIDLDRKDETLQFSVRDQGIGIPENIKDKVFDPFTAAKRRGTSGEQPFGLGLSISKQIVEAHKGRIWFDSEVEKGTTFYVNLPIAK